MTVTLHCPNEVCRRPFGVAEANLGRAVRCPHCQHIVTTRATGQATLPLAEHGQAVPIVQQQAPGAALSREQDPSRQLRETIDLPPVALRVAPHGPAPAIAVAVIAASRMPLVVPQVLLDEAAEAVPQVVPDNLSRLAPEPASRPEAVARATPVTPSIRRRTGRRIWIAVGLAVILTLGLGVAFLVVTSEHQPTPPVPSTPPPVAVTTRVEKPAVVEAVLPLDPVQRITYQFGGPMAFGLMVEGKRLTMSPVGGIQTLFKIDELFVQPAGPMVINRAPLAPLQGKRRIGEQTAFVFQNVRITQTVEVVPGKPTAKPLPGQRRRMDTVLTRYFIENRDQRPHNVALRVFMDILLVDNDGALFAAPNFPDKLLDGVELKDKQVPDYLQVLQRPDVKNPGYVAHFTYALGRERERPSRVVLTSLRATSPWDLQALPAMGDSAMAMFWDAKALPPGGKRELAYAYGQGIADSPDKEDSGAPEVEVQPPSSSKPPDFFTVTAVDNEGVDLRGPDGTNHRSAFRDLEIYDVRGKELTADDFRKRVKVGSVVVVAADENRVNPAYLRVLKEDSVVLVGVTVLLARADRPGRGWTMDLDKMKPLDEPVAGRLNGVAFKADSIQLQNTGLDLRGGSAWIHMFLILKPGQGIQDRSFVYGGLDQPRQGRPAIHIHMTKAGTGFVNTTGYAMRLVFGKEKNGLVPGRIYLCLPDDRKSFIAGTFTLNLQ